MKQTSKGKNMLKKAFATVLAATVAVSAAGALVACGDGGEEENGFRMTYELACQMNNEKFGVNEAAIDSSNYYGLKWFEDGFIRMADPEKEDPKDRANYYNIVKNLTIEKHDLDEFGNELPTTREYNIYGMFQVPLDFDPAWLDNPGDREFPLAIECHGFNTNSNGYLSAHWANTWTEKGYICYAFDFVGGAPLGKYNYGRGVRSGPKELKESEKGQVVDAEGNPIARPAEIPDVEGLWDEYGGGWMDMSVATEVQDLHGVIDEVKKLDIVDEENICLMGQSQGGVVCAVTAAERAAKADDEDEDCDIAGMVLIYPAFSFITDMHYFFGQNLHGDAPESLNADNYSLLLGTLDNEGRTPIMGANVGPRYISQCYNWGQKQETDLGVIKAGEYTMYHKIRAYKNSVLIVTGSTDTTVDTKWSFGAIYGNNSPYGRTQSTLTLVSDAEHAFDMMGSTPLKQKFMAYDALGNYLDRNNLSVK